METRVPHSTLNSLRGCWRSTAIAAWGSISTEADGKCLCCSVTGNALGKCQFVVDTSKDLLADPVSFPVSSSLFPPNFMCRVQEGFHYGKDYILEGWGKFQCRYKCLLIPSPVKHRAFDPCLSYLLVYPFKFCRLWLRWRNTVSENKESKFHGILSRAGILKVWESFVWAMNRSKTKHNLPSVFPGGWHNLCG